MELQETMNIDLDVKELEYIYESISFRLENDNHLMYHPDIRKDLEDMMAVWEDEYLTSILAITLLWKTFQWQI